MRFKKKKNLTQLKHKSIPQFHEHYFLTNP